MSIVERLCDQGLVIQHPERKQIADLIEQQAARIEELESKLAESEAWVWKKESVNKELEAENARLKTVPMKYRRMEFNAKLQQRIKELEAQYVELEDNCNCVGFHHHCNGVCTTCSKPVVNWKDAFETAVHAQENFPQWLAEKDSEIATLKAENLHLMQVNTGLINQLAALHQRH